MRPGVKKALTFLWIFIGAWLTLRCFLPLMAPFLLAAGIALLAEPGVRFLSGQMRLPRAAAAGISVTITVAGICVLILLACSFLLRELGSLAGILPDLEETAQAGIDILRSWLLDTAGKCPKAIRPFLQVNIRDLFSGGTLLLNRVSSYILGTAGQMLTHVPDSALTIGTAVLAAYMMSAKLPSIRTFFSDRLPMDKLKPVLETLRRIRSAAVLWLVSQIKLAGFTFAVLTAGFFLLRISYAPFAAFLTALVDAFPVLGTGTVLLPWSLICFLQGDTARSLGLLGLYAVVMLLRTTLEPRLVGRQLGLDPLVTLIALYAGYRLWGLPGMLLMPLLASSAFSLIP